MKDLIWLVVMVVLFCAGFTHVAAFLFGIFWVGFWQAFWVAFWATIAEGAKR